MPPGGSPRPAAEGSATHPAQPPTLDASWAPRAPDAAGALVAEHHRRAWRVALRLAGGDAAAALAAVEATFRRAARAGLEARHPEAGLRVDRLLLREAARARRRPFLRIRRAGPRASLAPPPARPAADGDEARLLRALGALPRRSREAVVLVHGEGLALEEAAARLGVRRSRLRRRLRRGLRALGRALRTSAPEPR